MMINPGGGMPDPGGFMRQPGQYISKRETSETESSLPVRQTNILARSVFLIEFAFALVGTMAFLAWGKLVLYAIGLIVITLVCFAWDRFNLWRATRNSKDEYDNGTPLFSWFVFAVGGVVAGHYIELAEPRFQWMTLAVFMAAYFILPPVLVSQFALSWRMFVETVDDSHPAPRAAISYPLAIMPWTRRQDIADWQDGDSSGDDEKAPTLDNIRALALELLEAQAKPTVRRDTIIVENRSRNGNGLHKSPAPGTDERIESEQVEHIEREIDGKGRVFYFVVEGMYKSAKVPLDEMRHFVQQAQDCGSSFRTWARRGITESRLRTIRKCLTLAQMIDPGDATIHEEIKWLVEPEQAMREFDRIFLSGDVPPTPLKSENGAENTGTSDRQTEEMAGVGG